MAVRSLLWLQLRRLLAARVSALGCSIRWGRDCKTTIKSNNTQDPHVHGHWPPYACGDGPVCMQAGVYRWFSMHGSPLCGRCGGRGACFGVLRCFLRLLLFCTFPPLCAGALWPMHAWVWRDVRIFFCFFLFLECVHLRDTRALTYVHMYIHLWCGPWGSCELDGLRILQVYHALCMRLEL